MKRERGPRGMGSVFPVHDKTGDVIAWRARTALSTVGKGKRKATKWVRAKTKERAERKLSRAVSQIAGDDECLTYELFPEPGLRICIRVERHVEDDS